MACCRLSSSLKWYISLTEEIVIGFKRWSRWRHQMKKKSVLPVRCAGNSSVADEFPSQRPVTRSFNVLFDLRLDKRLSEQPRRRWFETLSRSIWRHCNMYKVHGCRSWGDWGQTRTMYFTEQGMSGLQFIRACPSGEYATMQCTPDISRSLFHKNSRKTAKARPYGRDMVVFHEFEVWPKFYLRIYCIVCSIVFYCAVIYRESIVLRKKSYK